MAYSVALLKKDGKMNSQIEAPVGFALDVLFYPLLIACIFLPVSQVVSLLSSGSTIASVIVQIIFLCASVVAFGWAAFDRGDRSNGIRMGVFGVLTGGLSSIFFAFTYNRKFLNSKFDEGFRISEIHSPVQFHHQNSAFQNPVEFDPQRGRFFVWTTFFGVSFMKEFVDSTSALDFVKCEPNRSLKLRHIVKTLKSDAQHIEDPNRFVFPFESWGKELEMKIA